MSTEFERGRKDGQWTKDLVETCGWKSPKACLNNIENVYRDENSEYMQGYKEGARESLNHLSRRGK